MRGKDEMVRAPELHPAPGNVIVRICPRIHQTDTVSGVALALDSRYENQPRVAELVAIGEPLDDEQKKLCDWAIGEAEAGSYFIFTYSAGIEFWNPEMMKLLAAGYDFTWLRGLCVFAIEQLKNACSGTGIYGEKKPDDTTN